MTKESKEQQEVAERVFSLCREIAEAKHETEMVRAEFARPVEELEKKIAALQGVLDDVKAPVKDAEKEAKEVERIAKEKILALMQAASRTRYDHDAKGWVQVKSRKPKVEVDVAGLQAVMADDPAGHYAWLEQYITVTEQDDYVAMKWTEVPF